MSTNLRYEAASTHREFINGGIVATDLHFDIEIAGGLYAGFLRQDSGGIITVHGDTLPALIEALTEINELYIAAATRYSAATSGVREHDE